MATLILADFPTGAISDVIDHGKVLALGYILKAVAVLLMITSHTYIIILVAFVIRWFGV